MREDGVEIAPYAFPGVEPIADVRAAYEHLEVGQETEDRHRVAGRIAARRGAGKAAFLDLVDRSGKIQLHARADVLGADGSSSCSRSTSATCSASTARRCARATAS